MKNLLLSLFCFVMQLALAGCLTSIDAGAQELSVSTNIADYAGSGAANIEASYGFARHWTLTSALKYDPLGTDRQRTLSLGGRYWPWHIYSGWWLSGKMQYQEFRSAVSADGPASEGDRYGAGLAGGYARMLSKHLNVDLGIGLWGGYGTYTTYACPRCGRTLDSGGRGFVLPNDIILALSYIF